LMSALREIIVEYLVGQYDSGAPLLTVFDTNCGEVPPSVYEEFCVADLKYIATEVKRRRPNALMSVFPKDGEIATFNDSDYDVVGCSWTTSPARARRDCPDKTLQGNLDPYLLYADPAVIRERAARMVREFGVDKYICNLGHGMMPTHPTEGPQAFHDGVNSVSRDDAPTPAGVPATVAAAPSPPSVQASASPKLTLHLEEGTAITVPFAADGAKSLQQSLSEFIAVFKKKMAAEKPQRWENFDYTWAQDDLNLDVFCNPNAFSTIFDVKLFVTVRFGDQIKLTSDIPLSTLQSDIEAYMA